MEQPNVETVKVESSTNDAGQHQEEEKREGHGGGFGGRGRGGRGRGGGERRGGFDNRRGGGRWGQGRGGGGADRGDRGERRGNNEDQDQDGEGRDGGNRERGPRGGGRFGMRGPDDKFSERMQQIMGPTFDLPAVVMTEKKFNGRNRLYIGNIGNEVTEDDLIELFKPYGETTERFLNKEKNFAFVKVDYHSNAEKAKRELDGHVLKSRNLKIRFAPNSATVKVRNLTQYVTNELLHYAFSVFGEIERCVVSVDERGRPTGEATIDFARKGSALHAIRKCSDGCFFLTSSLRPCIVEAHEYVDDIDGYSDKNITKKTHDFHREREVGPRFASSGSFEHEYGMRWKQLYDLFAQKQESLKKELELEKEKLEAQMEYARYEHETEMLRDQLRARELDKERQKREWEMKQRQVEEERMRAEEMMRRKQEELESRMTQQKEDMRRRQQENNLFMQAHNLDSLLEEQEQAYDQPAGYGGASTGGGGGTGNIDDNGTMPQGKCLDKSDQYGTDPELCAIEENFRRIYGKPLQLEPLATSTPRCSVPFPEELFKPIDSPLLIDPQAKLQDNKTEELPSFIPLRCPMPIKPLQPLLLSELEQLHLNPIQRPTRGVNSQFCKMEEVGSSASHFEGFLPYKRTDMNPPSMGSYMLPVTEDLAQSVCPSLPAEPQASVPRGPTDMLPITQQLPQPISSSLSDEPHALVSRTLRPIDQISDVRGPSPWSVFPVVKETVTPIPVPVPTIIQARLPSHSVELTPPESRFMLPPFIQCDGWDRKIIDGLSRLLVQYIGFIT